MMQKLFLVCGVLGATTLFNAVAARADQALVAGDSNADTRSISVALRKRGFIVTSLTGSQVSAPRLKQTLQNLRKRSSADERFVFYFSGLHYLSRNSKPYIRLGDGSFAYVADLHREICAIPSSGRTVIFETAFRPPNVSQSTLQTTQAASGATPASKACYLLACRPSEQEAATEPHVFTRALIKQLPASLDSREPEVWSTVMARISREVMAQTNNRQRPRFTLAYANVPVFGSLSAAISRRVATNPLQPEKKAVSGKSFIRPRSLGSGTWGDYSEFNVLRSALDLRLQPEKIQVHVGEEVAFAVQVGESGYLVVLERGTSGKTNLVFPASGFVEDAVVERGQKMILPGEDEFFMPDSPGLERLRGFLFRDSASAQALLRNFENGSTLTPETPLKMKPVTPFTVLRGGFYTSDVLFEVLP